MQTVTHTKHLQLYRLCLNDKANTIGTYLINEKPKRHPDTSDNHITNTMCLIKIKIKLLALHNKLFQSLSENYEGINAYRPQIRAENNVLWHIFYAISVGSIEFVVRTIIKWHRITSRYRSTDEIWYYKIATIQCSCPMFLRRYSLNVIKVWMPNLCYVICVFAAPKSLRTQKKTENHSNDIKRTTFAYLDKTRKQNLVGQNE